MSESEAAAGAGEGMAAAGAGGAAPSVPSAPAAGGGAEGRAGGGAEGGDESGGAGGTGEGTREGGGGGGGGSAAAAADRKRGGLLAAAGFVGSALFGGVVGFGVQVGLESTGIFGTTLDAVAAEQRENFDKIRQKLEEISRAAPGSPEAAKLQRELAALMAQQEKLTSRAGDELKAAQAEISRLRDEAIRKTGSSSGADIWLLRNEAVDVGRRGIVLALTNIRASGSYADINLNGKSYALRPGEVVEFKDGDATCKVIYKSGVARSDGRYGFDFVREAR